MWSQIINQGLGTASKFVPGKINLGGKGNSGNSTAPWNTTLKVNPRRRASKGAYNP